MGILWAVVAVLAGAVGVACPNPEPGIVLLLLAGVAVPLALWAVPLPVQGTYDGSVAVYLAALLIPGVGARFALSLACLGILLRTWRTGRARPRRSQDALADAAAVVGAAVAATVVPGTGAEVNLATGLAVVVGYLVVMSFFPRVLARGLSSKEQALWQPVADQLRILFAGLALGSVGMALLMTQTPWFVVWMVPLLLGCNRAAENTIYRVHAGEARSAIARLQLSKRELEDAQSAAQRARQALEFTAEQRDLLEGFSQQLASHPGPEEVLWAVLSTVGVVAPCRSLVVFLSQDRDLESLWPARFVSPDGERLENAALLKMREPVVDEAWRLSIPVVSHPGLQQGPRLLDSEVQAIAFPLDKEGVLYLGRAQDEPFTQEEAARVAWIADKAVLAIASARRNQAREFALALHSRAHYVLQERVKLLARLNEGSRDIASSLDPERLLEAVKNFLESAVGHEVGAVMSRAGQHYWSRGGELHQGLRDLPLSEVTQAVAHSLRPLTIPDLEDPNCRFAPPVEGMRSLLCVPMVTQQGLSGVILLMATSPGSFTREHQDLLSTIANQAAVGLANARLYQEVVEGRRQLEESQAQLIQTSKLMAVGQLAAGVAHELNTPLGVVALALGAIEFQMESNPEAARRKLEKAIRATRRARHIIKKLLLYSRKSGDQEEEVDLNRVVSDAVDFVAHHLDQGGCQITMDLGEVAPVSGKPEDLQQVLVNLVMNALYASAEVPSESRRIRLFTGMEGAHTVVAGVQDWGRGIAPENLDRVFEPFFTTKDVGEGTGLGLSVSHQIVARHKGKLEAASSPGQGATFSMRLPVLAGETNR